MKKILIALCFGLSTTMSAAILSDTYTIDLKAVYGANGISDGSVSNKTTSEGTNTGAKVTIGTTESYAVNSGNGYVSISHGGEAFFVSTDKGYISEVTWYCVASSAANKRVACLGFSTNSTSNTSYTYTTKTDGTTPIAPAIALNEPTVSLTAYSGTGGEATLSTSLTTMKSCAIYKQVALSLNGAATVRKGEGSTFGIKKVVVTVKYNDAGGGTSYDVAHTLTGVTKTSGDVGTGVASSGSAYSAVFAASAGYALPDDITVTIGGSAATVETDYTWNPSTGAFQVPAARVTGNIVVTITGCATHTVTASVSGSGGTVSSDKDALCAGKTATITAVPTSGYRVSNWAVSGTGSTISPNGPSSSTTTALTMGSDNTTVTVTFEEIPACTAPALSAPASATVYDDQEKSATKALAVTVSNSGAMTSLSYQWYSDTNADATGGTALTTSGEIAKGSQGATYSSTTSSEFSTSLYYYCVVTNTCGVGDVASTTSYPFTVTTKDCVSPGLSISKP